MTIPPRILCGTILLPVGLILISGCTTTPANNRGCLQVVDSAGGSPSADGAVTWFNALDIGLEGQAWTDVKHPYDRLPARAEGVVRDAVWSLSHDSAGLCVRFITDSPTIAARWSLRSDELAMNHMPATGVSGLDLYVKQDGVWGWVGVGRPEKVQANESTLMSGAPEGAHEYMLYLPLYNGVESLEIGVKTGAMLAKAAPYPSNRAKPMLFWGTSILQGGCASRPGMAYPSIIGRRMQRPIVNLGFSGNGRMDPEVTALIAQLDVSVYVIDCAPNMPPELIAERTEPLVRMLRAARPTTPIVLVECVPYQQGWFLAAKREAYMKKNAALKTAYERLVEQGVKRLYYIRCDQLLGVDYEAAVDGTHPTDVGFLRMADVIIPVLNRALEE